MSQQPFVNYLEDAYLQGPPGYLAGTFGELTGVQSEMVIDDMRAIATQVEMQIADHLVKIGMQAELQTDDALKQGLQVLLEKAQEYGEGAQVDMRVTGINKITGMEVKIGKLTLAYKGKYLEYYEGYLTGAYLAEKWCGFQGAQVEAKIVSEVDDRFEGIQVDQKIDSDDKTGTQIELRIDTEQEAGIQVRAIRALRIGMQANFLIYNVTQLRILCDFASRGVDNEYNGVDGGDDANWKTPQAMAADDLGKLGNLNTDVLEQRVQTADGVTASWELQCDTGVGNTFIDTLFIGEHNLTRSANITVQLSDSPTFSTIKDSFTVDVNNGFDLQNAYYIAPEPPTIPGRYVRILIQDSTNPDNHLRIGVIAFGSSDIFTPRECFDNPANFGFQHFKDTVDTEGFSNNSNDRATRKKLSLSFTNLRLQGGNFGLIRDYIETAKTDLKCLIIPYPQRAAALAVFSKLVSLPEESHNASSIDDTDPTKDEWRVSLSLDWDESL